MACSRAETASTQRVIRSRLAITRHTTAKAARSTAMSLRIVLVNFIEKPPKYSCAETVVYGSILPDPLVKYNPQINFSTDFSSQGLAAPAAPARKGTVTTYAATK